jgi:hypothetical protein
MLIIIFAAAPTDSGVSKRPITLNRRDRLANVRAFVKDSS